jgi:endonuclease/exonuclease/phosphatase family metal-dependent hydrolase
MRRGLFLVFVLAGIACFGQGTAIKVMTYNIRFDNPDDGVNQWSQRKQKVFDLLRTYNPDILGLQEALTHQIEDITAANGYIFVGVGRDDGKKKGEYSPILFRKDRFEIVEQNTFWLSETPTKPGSKSWDAAITRVATWAIMKDKLTNRKFLVMNTHFDHIGAEARKNSAAMIKQKASDLAPDIPMIITGDLNTTRDEPPYQILTNNELIELIDPATAVEGTYCTFKVNSEPCRAIDYILLSNEWRADQYKVISDNDGTYYPSDHLPVMITLSYSE